MNQLNYHHLYYFYVIAREGSIVKASAILHLTPQTLSGQLSVFESFLNTKVFDRKGKRLVLNETGKMVLSYAEDIFSLGGELQQALKKQPSGYQDVFIVGVTDVIPKIFLFDLLKTCFDAHLPLKLVCREGDLDMLLADMAVNKLDLIISDRPLSPGSAIKAYSHFLGEAGLSFYAEKKMACGLIKAFPYSLDNAPFLMTGDKSTQKLSLLSWFDHLQIHPHIVAEFDDTALMKFFGQSGYGIFCTPTSIEQHVIEQYSLTVIGRTTDIGERVYAISPERKIKHPGVKFLVSNAKKMFE